MQGLRTCFLQIKGGYCTELVRKKGQVMPSSCTLSHRRGCTTPYSFLDMALDGKVLVGLPHNSRGSLLPIFLTNWVLATGMC